MKNKRRILAQISDFIFFSNISFSLWTDSIKRKFLRAIHCKRGYHNFNVSSVTVNNSRGETHSDYAQCRNCNVLLFTSELDHQNYDTIRAQEKEFWKRLFDTLLLDKKNKQKKQKATKKKKQ